MMRNTLVSGTWSAVARASAAAVAALIFAPSSAFADTAAASDTLAPITVTAERRTESIQDVPVSVTAITGVTLEKFVMQDFADYAGTVPNLSWGAGGDQGVSNTLTISIRGIVGGRSKNEQNTTSFYIDDTPVPQSIDPRILDLQRVEVLRGPQGTLFGSAAMGGTIRIITRPADAQTSYGSVEVQGFDINHGGAGYDQAATYNMPLVQDELALKISEFSTYKPGIFTREYGISTVPGHTIPAPATVGEDTHIGDDQELGGMLTLTYTPSALPGLTVTPRAIYQSARSNGFPLADYTPSDLIQVRPLDVHETWRDDWTFFSLTNKYKTDFGTFFTSSGWFHRIGYDLEDGTETNSNAAKYATAPLSTILSTTYLPGPVPSYIYYITQTQEVRFESSFAAPVQVIVGGYYDHSFTEQLYPDYAPYQSLTTPYQPNGEFYYYADIPNYFNELAAFADLSYKPIAALELSAGLRDATLGYKNVNVEEGWVVGGSSTTLTSHEEHALTPRYTAKYTINPNAMVYANAAKGYRIGGENSGLPYYCAGEAPANGAYNSDSLWSYEIGSKNTLLDGRLSTRAAAYRIDWKNMQQTIYLPCLYTVVENAGAATSTGAELEANMAPIHGLNLNLGLGFDNAKITSAPPGSNFFLGQRLSGVPKWTASLLGEYTVPTTYGAMFFREQYTFAGSSISYNNPPNPTPGRERASYSLVDLVGGESRGPWDISLVIKNVFDVRANLGDEQTEAAELPARPRWLVAQPRTIGFQIVRKFKGQ